MTTLQERSVLDFTAATAAPDRGSMLNLVHRMQDLGFEECIAYAWANGAVTRPTQELLAFVAEDLPSPRTD